MEGVVEGLAHLASPTVLMFAMIGILVAQVFAVLPGLGGAFPLAMMLSFVYTMDPIPALAMIVAAAVTTGTGNTITSVLVGVPGSATGVVSVFDGYPLAKQGQGARAVAAGLTASLVAGVLGALALGLFIPLVRSFVLAIGSPEYLALMLAAVILGATLGRGDPLKGLVAGGVGVLLSFVGREANAGELRYTFGLLELWEGVPLVAFFIGLFAVAEMLNFIRQGGTISKRDEAAYGRGVRRGVFDVFRRWRVTAQSAVIGGVVGAIPGVGSSASQFIAYGAAKRISKEPEKFGEGSIEGVIAADGVQNSTDAGAMVPTLGFGIPGNASTAFLLAAFMAVGLQPGPRMLSDNVDVVWMIIWLLVFANIVAAALCLLAAPWLSRLTVLPTHYLVVPILGLSFLGAYIEGSSSVDIAVVAGAGLLGYAMMRYGYSRATMIIGYILGALIERHLLVTQSLHGWSALARPGMLVIFALGTAMVVFTVLSRRRARRRQEIDASA